MPAPLPPNSFYVVSYPRSGNTWLINCLTMLLDGVRGEAYTPFKLYTELHGNPAEGFHFWCEPRKRPDQPICIKSHDDLVTFHGRHPPGSVIYIARDARDALLSFYFFQQAYAAGEELGTRKIQGTEVLTSRGAADPVFDAADFRAFLRREAPAWAAHVASARRDPGVCFLTYEQLMRDFAGSLGRALAFLKIPAVHSYEETAKVYHSGFGAVFAGNNRDFFRRGQIGDWKNWYDSSHARLVQELIGTELRELGFETDPSWAEHWGQPPAAPATSPPAPTEVFEVDVAYTGDYASFAEARACSTGYEEGVILERTRAALHKVLRGEAAYERDSVTFDTLELPLPLLGHLRRIAAENGGRLSVLDFGGSLGSTYFQCRSALADLPALEWSIVELPALVACGQREFANGTLQFYPTIQDCLQSRRPTVLLISGVLQCLPEPWTFLRETAGHGFSWIILDRTPFIPSPRDRLTVERVSPRIYPASYPAWFFSWPRLKDHLPAGWSIEGEFDAIDRQLLDGVEITFRGLALRRNA